MNPKIDRGSLYRTPPVSNLPTEVLGLIFSLNISHRRESFITTLRTSHVCALWRCIAIKSPELWLPFALPGWEGIHEDFARILLARSQPYPVDAGWHRKNLPKFIDLTERQLQLELSHFYRMRSYFLKFTAKQLPLIAPYFSYGKAAEMEELRLEAFGDSTYERSFPAYALANKNSRLRSIHLSGCWMDLSNLPLSNLQQLTIDLSFASSHISATVRDYLKIVSSCRNLRAFELSLPWSFRLPETDDNYAYELYTTPPTLQKLSLSLPPLPLETFLNHISLPEVTRLHLLCPYSMPDSFSQVFQNVIGEKTARPPHSMSKMRIISSTYHVGVAIGPVGQNQYSPPDYFLETAVSSRLDHTASDIWWDDFYRAWYLSIPSITTLQITFSPIHPKVRPALLGLLLNAECVTTLHDINCHTCSLLEELQHEAFSQDPGLVLFPKLERIVCHAQFDWRHNVLFSLESLIQFVTHRKAIGKPIQSVAIEFDVDEASRDMLIRNGLTVRSPSNPLSV